MKDAVLMEVMGNALRAAAEEMGVALVRAAYSTNIRDRKDCSCAVFDAKGNMIGQAEHIPAHLGSMAAAVKAVLQKHPREEVRPGDAFAYNDPFTPGGSHLPDIALVAPVFVDGELAFWAVNRAHHSDVGGMVPGSTSARAEEIYQEGLRIPIVRIQREGRIDDDLLELICLNVRTPEERRGDLLAQFAANNVGSQRLRQLANKYGLRTVQEYASALIDHTEKRVRAHLRELPEGSYEGEDFLEWEGAKSGLINIKVRAEIRDGTFLADFAGTHPQVLAPFNIPIDNVKTAVYYVVKGITDWQLPFNEGVFRPISVTAPAGSIVNPVAPAATGMSTSEAPNRIVDALLKALAPVVPDRVTAASCSTRNTIIVGGHDRRSRRSFIYYETYGGGQGARPNKDGMDAVPSHLGNTANAPTEMTEAHYPLWVRRYSIVRDSEGSGRFRGGLGVLREVEVLEGAEGLTLSTLCDRRKLRPYGLFGGKPGALGHDFLERDGKKQQIPGKTVMPLRAGDRHRIESPGGGGYGDPLTRDPHRVLEDVLEGWVNPQRADQVYGVVLRRVGSTYQVDEEATRRRRSSSATQTEEMA